MPINTRQHARVRELRFSNPPVNALSIRSGLCGELTEAITAALADAAVDSIIVAGDGAMFSAGADIADFAGDPEALNILRGLHNRIERAGKFLCPLKPNICHHHLGPRLGEKLRDPPPDAAIGPRQQQDAL